VWIIIACETDLEWTHLVRLIGESSWAGEDKFATKTDRKKNQKELDQYLAQWTKRLTPRLAFSLLQKAGVPAGIPMSGEDLYYDIHLRARQHIVETDTAPWGNISHHGLPGIPSLSAADAARPAPWIGADNDYVFGAILRMSPEDVMIAKSTGAIK
jgi:formyl-CoA transferase